jgi:fructose-bisphosphate aldolase class II
VTLAATADLIASATRERTALLAFNVITLDHAEGIAEGRNEPAPPS